MSKELSIPLSGRSQSGIFKQRAYRWLASVIEKDTIPHAFLFTGLQGVGKRTAAITFAMACNCRSPESENKIPCGVCRSCSKIISNHHPDIRMIEPIGSAIKISQIRDLYHTLSMKPFEAEKRVICIADAQAMNPEASNALLKILEEPPTHTILILTAGQASDLLETIVSRCLQIRFDPVTHTYLESYLNRDCAVNRDRAELFSHMACGSITRAKQLAEDVKGDLRIHKRNLLVEALSPGMAEAAKHTDQGERLHSLFMLSETLCQKKAELEETLDLLGYWLRDLLVYPYVPDKIVNQDLEDVIRKRRVRLKTEVILRQIIAVENAKKDIRANANARLALDVLFMTLIESMKKGGH